MEHRKENPVSDAAWYCRRDAEEERFYEIFFQMCRKYAVRWASADEKERRFIEEITRVTYERERVIKLGLPHPRYSCLLRTWTGSFPRCPG